MDRDAQLIKKLKELKEKTLDKPMEDIRSRRFARHWAGKTRRMMFTAAHSVGEEAWETEKMARSFFQLLEAKLDLKNRKEPPSEEEVKEAIEQLKDVGRFGVFVTLVIIPGGVVSLLGLEMLARRFGLKTFNLIPSSFRKRNTSLLPETQNKSQAKPDDYEIDL